MTGDKSYANGNGWSESGTGQPRGCVPADWQIEEARVNQSHWWLFQ